MKADEVTSIVIINVISLRGLSLLLFLFDIMLHSTTSDVVLRNVFDFRKSFHLESKEEALSYFLYIYINFLRNTETVLMLL